MRSNGFPLPVLALAVLVLLVALEGTPAAGQSAQGAAESVTVAVTGDVDTPSAKVVSDMILAQPAVAAVLLAGDTDNGKSTPLESYQELYNGSFGRFISKLYPAPGNHDEHSKPPFSGYCTFWGPAAHCPEMYYSFDVGGWHIVSLDSVTFREGKDAATAQLKWLKADLAAHPKKPILAYWHYPLFSRTKHHGDKRMKPLWETLQAHGPAIVINGHNHVYERFKPLDPDGNPTAESKGIQEFVVGPGGAKPVNEQNSTGGPVPAKFSGGTQHVGFFTLHPDGGYTFTINSLSASGETAIVDAGGGNLLGGPKPGLAPSPATTTRSMGGR